MDWNRIATEAFIRPALPLGNFVQSIDGKGVFREFQGIFTAMVPEDRELYAARI